MSIKEQIKAEIEWLKKGIGEYPPRNEYERGYDKGGKDYCEQIIGILDTLKEQPVDTSEDERIREEIKNFLDDICYLKASITPEDLDRDAISRWIAYLNRQSKEQPVSKGLEEKEPIDGVLYAAACGIKNSEKEQPVCEGLEEEIKMYFEDWDTNPNGAFFDKEGYKIGTIALKNIARHFYNLGKQEKSELPTNLDEAAERYATEDDGWNPDGTEKYQVIPQFADAFKAGAMWDREQGVSFNTEVGWIDGPTIMDWPDDILDGFKMGDKVIVQIRKKDE